MAKCLRITGLVNLKEQTPILIDLGETDEHSRQDREEGNYRRHQDFRRNPGPAPDDQQRRQSHDRDRLERRSPRQNHLSGGDGSVQNAATDEAGGQSDQKSGESLGESSSRVLDELKRGCEEL